MSNAMTKRNTMFRILAFIMAMWIFGASPLRADLMYSIEPVDSLTRLPVSDVEILVFVPGDSVVVAEGKKVTLRIDGRIPRQVGMIGLPNKDADYNIYLDAPGYQPRYIPLHVDEDHNISSLHELGEIGLLRTARQLDEVTVTATKIKMYYKGDTIVYNADAFLLPEGSMLDDLIRKLPGITINRHGEIFSNGRKIESLQLEGRKLFDGSPRTLLENLGAYTVSKVKVYEQTDSKDDFLGYSDKDRTPLVMDVILKKEYAIGKWVNVDAGYGTHNRYLGRGFMLGFTNTLALSAFVNANNLSADSDPGHGDYWTTNNVGTSESSYLSGGLSYQYESNGRKRAINGNLSVNSSKVTERSGSEKINFLPTGDTYETRFARQHPHSFEVSTDHSLKLQSATKWFEIKPRFNFSHHNSNGDNVAAAFDDDPGKISATEIEAIFSGSEEKLRECLINRELRRSKYNTSNIGGNLSSTLVFKLPAFHKNSHNLTFSLGGNYRNVKRNTYNQFTIDYGACELASIGEYAYTRGHPQYNASISGTAKYEINFRRKHTVWFSYSLGHDRERTTTDRYLLSDLQEATLESLKFGQEPAADLLADVLDPVNSNHSTYHSNSHVLTLSSRFVWGNGDLDDDGAFGNIFLFVNPSLRILHRNLDFHKADYDTTAIRSFVLPQISTRLNYSASRYNRKYTYFASLGWNSNPRLFSMSNLIDVYNTSDPLNIFRGNPDLRTSYIHRASVQLQFSKTKGNYQSHTLNFSYSFTDNDIVSGMIYDPLTGVRIRSMYNVGGKRGCDLEYTGNGVIKKWSEGSVHSVDYSAGLSAYDHRNVNVVGVDNLRPVKTFVLTRSVTPNARLSFMFGNNHDVSLSFTGNFTRYSGENITAFTSANNSYGISATFQLPANFRLSSVLTLYCHRGYSDPTLNTDEYIWNASASWHWKKAHLTFVLDGYDLLHQLKSVSQYVNSFGRTESWSNTLPRYAMLRVRYHLDLSPR